MATMIAIWAYAAYKYDASPGEISLYGLAFSVPGVVLGPISGVVIDKYGPKATLFGAKALGVVASMLLLGANSFLALTILSALHGVGQAFSRPALNSIPPRIVDDEHLARTNALVGLTDQISIVIGPVVAGVAIGVFGFKGAFVIDGLTYLLGILVLPLVQLRPVDSSEMHASEGSAWRDAIAGWRLVARIPMVRLVVITSFVINLLYGTAMLAEPLYVRDVLERSTSVFAALQSVFGILLVLGGLLAARVGDRMATMGWVNAGVIGSAIAGVLYLGTENIVIAFIGVSVWGLFTALIWGPSRTVMQRAAPESAHGRVMAADQMAQSLATFLGLGVAGITIGAFGVQRVVIGLAVFVVVAGVLVELASRRHLSELRELSEPDALVAGVEAG